MVKINENLKCKECGSVWQEIAITPKFHKVLLRKCYNGCSHNKEILEDYGYSKKAELKNINKSKK